MGANNNKSGSAPRLCAQGVDRPGAHQVGSPPQRYEETLQSGVQRGGGWETKQQRRGGTERRGMAMGPGAPQPETSKNPLLQYGLPRLSLFN